MFHGSCIHVRSLIFCGYSTLLSVVIVLYIFVFGISLVISDVCDLNSQNSIFYSYKLYEFILSTFILQYSLIVLIGPYKFFLGLF